MTSSHARASIALATIAVVAMTTSTPAQQARDANVGARGSAIVTGVVVADDNGRPVGRALVTVKGVAPAFAAVASTDADGRFALTGLPAGDITMTATKTTYLTAYFGAHDPIRGPAVPVTIATGAPLDVKLRLIRGAVIAGVVTGTTGRPQAGTLVSANLSRLVGGTRRLVGGPVGHGGLTDDKGRYRIWGLAPGEYVVQATPIDAQSSARAIGDVDLQAAGTTPTMREVRFAPVYYPGAIDASEAAVVPLQAAQERDGIDVALRPIATADVRGVLTGIDGQPAGQATVALDGALDHFTTISDSGGRFAFRSVAPGRFALTARGSGRPQTSSSTPSAEDLWAWLDISVSGDSLDNLALSLQRGMTAAGRIVFEGSSQVNAAQAVVTLTPAGDRTGTAKASQGHATADGRFTISDLAPGTYAIRAAYTGSAGPSGPWLAKSVLSQGQDLLDGTLSVAPGQDVTDVSVVFSDRQTELRGTFYDSAGHPVPGYDVVVFATDRRFWTPGSRRVQHLLLGRDGHFDFDNLPAGDYLLAAVTHADADDLADPDWLDAVAPLALHVTLADGEHKTQDIRLGR